MKFNDVNSEIDFLAKKIIKILNKEKKINLIFKKFSHPQIIIAPPSLMKKLEKIFLKKDKEADILSFNWPQGFLSYRKPFLGEIYLNKKIIKNKEYLKYLLVHGILHLLGFDHHKKNDIIKMENKEKKVLKKLSILSK